MRSHGWRHAYEAVVLTGRHQQTEFVALIGGDAAKSVQPFVAKRPTSQARLSAFVDRNLEPIRKIIAAKVEAGEGRKVRSVGASAATVHLVLTADDLGEAE